MMNSTQTLLFRRLFESLCILLLASMASLNAQIVTFNSNESVELESGWIAIAQPSGFTAAQQAQIMQLVNAKLKAAGINLNATSGSSGACRIIISDSQAPPIPPVQGSETDIGAGDGEPSIVFIREHPSVPIYEHVNDIANAIKALIAAKHGAGANYNSTASAMTQIQGSARFTDLGYGSTATTQLALNSGIMNAMTETSSRPTDVRYRLDTTPGRRLRSLDVQLTYQAGLQNGSRFGHLRADGTFVAHGQQGSLESAPASFFFDGEGVDFAVELSNGAIYALSNGAARVRLLSANANNPDVYDRIAIEFDVDGDRMPDASVEVRAVDNDTGGFYTNVYPGTGEDLFLSGSLNVRAAFLAGQRAQVAKQGETLNVHIQSFEKQFQSAPVFLVGEVFGATPPVPIAGLPGIHFSATGNMVLLSGTLGATGLRGSLLIPAGLSGLHVLLQGVALGAQAGNGLYGASDAMTVTFL